MSKSKLSFNLVLALFGIALFITGAQAFFSSTTQLPQSSSNSSAVQSPNDFKNHVNTLSQQTQNSLNEQLKQSMSKNPAPALPPPPAPVTSNNNQQTTTENTSTSGNNNSTSSSQNNNASAPAQPATTAQQATQAPTETAPAPAPTSSAQQGYTGFGFQNGASSGSSNSNSQSSDSWNIKY